jgi:hypothetical protein
MRRLQKIIATMFLVLAVSFSALAGDITGRNSAGDITGKTGVITNKPGDITGKAGDITGKAGDITGGLLNAIVMILSTIQ